VWDLRADGPLRVPARRWNVFQTHADIGPEEGFSQAEGMLAKEKEFLLVSLGPNILRTETAAIAAVSMIGYACRM